MFKAVGLSSSTWASFRWRNVNVQTSLHALGELWKLKSTSPEGIQVGKTGWPTRVKCYNGMREWPWEIGRWRNVQECEFVDFSSCFREIVGIEIHFSRGDPDWEDWGWPTRVKRYNGMWKWPWEIGRRAVAKDNRWITDNWTYSKNMGMAISQLRPSLISWVAKGDGEDMCFQTYKMDVGLAR